MKSILKNWYACLIASILVTNYTIPAIERNLIEKMQVTAHSIYFTLNKEFHEKYLWEDFYVIYQDDIDLTTLDYTILTMPLLLNVFSIVLISGEEYFIDAMDEDLYHSLSIVAEALKRLYPRTVWQGRLTPRKLINNKKIWEHKKIHPGFAMPFSHGLDSICTSLRHKQTPQLLMTVRGCPDTPIKEKWDFNWYITQRTIKQFAEQFGHTTSFVDSNFHEFFNWDVLSDINPEIMNWRMDTIEDLGWIGIAAPILITKGIQKLILAANKDWSTPHPGISSPVTNDTMTFAGVTVKNDAFELSRTEKNFVVAQICNKYKLKKPTTFVCEKISNGRKNCSECTKCVFTILSWILAKEQPRDYGFNVMVIPFLNYFKNQFFLENLYSPYRAGCFKYMQLKAHQVLNTLRGEIHDFFSWFLTIDFDALTVPTPQIIVDYDDFRDLYPGIPSDWRKYRDELEITHSANALTNAIYQQIWNNPYATKAIKKTKTRQRRIRKRT